MISDGEPSYCMLAVDDNERFLNLHNDEFQRIMEGLEAEVEALPDDVEANLLLLENHNVPASTKAQMLQHVSRFRQFLQQKNLSTEFETIPNVMLNKYLTYFYSELRKRDGNYYSPPSLICIRASIQRHFNFLGKTVNILSDTEFGRANRMLKAMVGKYLRSPNRSLPEEKFPPIEEVDMKKLRAYFDRKTPLVVLEEFAFNCMYFLGLRGRETLRELDKESFSAVELDSEGRRFFRLVGNFNSKNCKGSTSAKEFENARKTRVYECKDRPEECPVECYLLFVSKLPEHFSSGLFPKPSVRPKSTNDWFCEKLPVGKNFLGELMSKLSQKADLSKRYTNHCVRVTTVSVLKEQGYTNDDICHVTGHKNPASVQRYVKKRKDDSFFFTSDALQAGSSKTESRRVIPVGRGKIMIHETSKETVINGTTPSFGQSSFNFSGSFHNCKFLFNKEDTIS